MHGYRTQETSFNVLVDLLIISAVGALSWGLPEHLAPGILYCWL